MRQPVAVWLRSGLCGQVQGWGPELGGRIPAATWRPGVISGVHVCPFADTAALPQAGSDGVRQPPSLCPGRRLTEMQRGAGRGWQRWKRPPGTLLQTEVGGDEFICAVLSQSCRALCDPMDCSPPGPSVHGILQARILGGLPSSPGDLPDQGLNHVSCPDRWFFAAGASCVVFSFVCLSPNGTLRVSCLLLFSVLRIGENFQSFM